MMNGVREHMEKLQICEVENMIRFMDEFYMELHKAVDQIRPYYDVDKIKPYSVYIWTKDYQDGDNKIYGDNVFDIMKDEIVFYDKTHVISDEVMPIIRNIQSKLME